MKEEYLGDGLYASFDGMIRLRAAGREHEVYLEPEVFAALVDFAKRVAGWTVESTPDNEQ